jgi:hypothetical protein
MVQPSFINSSSAHCLSAHLRVDSPGSANRLVKKCHLPPSCSSHAYRCISVSQQVLREFKLLQNSRDQIFYGTLRISGLQPFSNFGLFSIYAIRKCNSHARSSFANKSIHKNHNIRGINDLQTDSDRAKEVRIGVIDLMCC